MTGAPRRVAVLLLVATFAASLTGAATLRELEDAMMALEDAQGSTSPAVRDARYDFAQALLEEGNNQDAAAQLRLVVFAYEEDPAASAEDSLPARIDLGEALRAQGAHEEAAGAYQGAIELARDLGRTDMPRLGGAYLGMGISAASSGDCSLALESFAKAPAGVDAEEVADLQLRCLRKLTRVERRARRLSQAGAYAEQAIELGTRRVGADSPGLAPDLEQAALIHAEAGDVDGAKERARRASELRKANGEEDSPWNRTVKAIILDHAGQGRKAMQWLKHAAKQAADQDHPQRAAILQEFATFLRRHGKKKAAVRLEKKARSLGG